MPDFYLKRGDNLSEIEAQLTDGLGVPINLYGATVKFSMRSFLTGQLIFQNSATIKDATQGIVSYAWQLSDTDTASGDYYGEWQVERNGGSSKQSFPTRGYHLISLQDDLDSPSLTPEEFRDVREVRGMISESEQNPYTDSTLSAMLDRNGGDKYKTAAEVWRQKAAAYSELVDVSESGNSQKLSQLYPRATALAEKYENASANGGFNGTGAGGVTGYAVTRPIERV